MNLINIYLEQSQKRSQIDREDVHEFMAKIFGGLGISEELLMEPPMPLPQVEASRLARVVGYLTPLHSNASPRSQGVVVHNTMEFERFFGRPNTLPEIDIDFDEVFQFESNRRR